MRWPPRGERTEETAGRGGSGPRECSRWVRESGAPPPPLKHELFPDPAPGPHPRPRLSLPFRAALAPSHALRPRPAGGPLPPLPLCPAPLTQPHSPPGPCRSAPPPLSLGARGPGIAPFHTRTCRARPHCPPRARCPRTHRSSCGGRTGSAWGAGGADPTTRRPFSSLGAPWSYKRGLCWVPAQGESQGPLTRAPPPPGPGTAARPPGKENDRGRPPPGSAPLPLPAPPILLERAARRGSGREPQTLATPPPASRRAAATGRPVRREEGAARSEPGRVSRKGGSRPVLHSRPLGGAVASAWRSQTKESGLHRPDGRGAAEPPPGGSTEQKMFGLRVPGRPSHQSTFHLKRLRSSVDATIEGLLGWFQKKGIWKCFHMF